MNRGTKKLPESNISFKSLVEYELYVLSGKDEITRFLYEYNLKHGEMKVETPWPQDYLYRDIENHYVFENYDWLLEFGMLPKQVLAAEKNIKEKNKIVKNSIKIITKCILEEYAPLIIAQKAFIKQQLFSTLLCLISAFSDKEVPGNNISSESGSDENLIAI